MGAAAQVYQLAGLPAGLNPDIVLELIRRLYNLGAINSTSGIMELGATTARVWLR
jgi:hypothetical protein